MMNMKKFILVQLWRIQQIGMVASLSLLALNLALTVNKYIEWRFSNSYMGTILILVTLAFIIWGFGYVWDKFLKLWKEQTVVSTERNPYSTIQMTPKEILAYTTIYIPWLKELGQHDSAELWQKIVDWNLRTDKNLVKAVKEIEAIK